MIWTNRTIKPKKGGLKEIELEILNFLIEELNSNYGVLIKNQIPYFVKTIRNEYPNDQIVEFYPDRFGMIPQEFLFGRTEEFKIATINFTLGDKKYKATIGAVMGFAFDMKISPKIPNRESGQLRFSAMKATANFDNNTFGREEFN